MPEPGRALELALAVALELGRALTAAQALGRDLAPRQEGLQVRLLVHLPALTRRALTRRVLTRCPLTRVPALPRQQLGLIVLGAAPSMQVGGLARTRYRRRSQRVVVVLVRRQRAHGRTLKRP